MRKTKEILSFILVFVMILLSANFTFAGDKKNAITTDSLGNQFNWEYELNDKGEIINLVCKNSEKTSVNGDITIPEKVDEKTVVELGYGAFEEYKGITGITIPNSITKIGGRAFENCTGLKKINFGTGVTEIGDHAFENCTGLTSVKFPKSLKESTIAPFSGCDNITKVTFEEGTTIIPYGLCMDMKDQL